jgi:hypothetical protein
MITTLILGAGTSCPYGYPTGAELLIRVKEVLAREKVGLDAEIWRGLEHIGIESLDAYMNLNEASGPRIKEVIAELIHSYEDENGFNLPAKESPYAKFMATIPPEKYEDFRIISFNYDRSLEFYLTRGIQALKRSGTQQAFQLLNNLKIIHVHGRLSNLPHEEGFENNHARQEMHYGYYSKVLPQLKRARSNRDSHPYLERDLIGPITLHGQQTLKNCFENNGVCEPARTAIEESDRVCFMGFGFHATNMATLGYPFKESGKKKVFGTTWKMDGNDFRRVQAHYPEIRLITECTAVGLLRNYVDLADPTLDDVKN